MKFNKIYIYQEVDKFGINVVTYRLHYPRKGIKVARYVKTYLFKSPHMYYKGQP